MITVMLAMVLIMMVNDNERVMVMMIIKKHYNDVNNNNDNNSENRNRSNSYDYISYNYDYDNDDNNGDENGKVRMKITRCPKCRMPNKIIIIFRENILEDHVIMPFRAAKEGVMPFRTWQRHGDGTSWMALTNVGVCLI